MIRYTILTTFPEYFTSPLTTSILGKAIEKQVLSVDFLNLRDFTTDVHRTTDDRPYAGGPGMVMKIEPIDTALCSLEPPASGLGTRRTILLSARGKRYTQEDARRLSAYSHLVLICGHYADVDQRVADHLVDEEVSVGDFVLTSGELGAMVVIDSVSRLIPGCLGNSESIQQESHEEIGRLSPPAYTRPEEYKGWKVPSELLSGNPKLIEEWKKKNSANPSS